MRTFVKRKLKGKVKWAKSLRNAWEFFKNAMLDAQLECILQIRKRSMRAKKMLALLTSRIKEKKVLLARRHPSKNGRLVQIKRIKCNTNLGQKMCKHLVKDTKKRKKN